MQNILTANYIILGISTTAMIVSFFCLASALKMKKRLKIFFNGSRAQDLEALLAQEIKKVRNIEVSLNTLKNDHKDTKNIAKKSIHKIDMIRFNPFKDMGGNQSFAVALLDAKNNGIALSSIYSRTGARTYAKKIQNGKSRHDLSVEEKELLQKVIKIS